MLTKRIIPCLDIDEGRVVKGVSFIDLKDAGDPRELAILYDDQGADELVFLDITASVYDRNIMIDVVKSVSEEVFIPLTVGGGVRSLSDIRGLLEAGADKVSLNTAAIKNPELVSKASSFFGAQCIVAAIDVKRKVGRGTYVDSANLADKSIEIDASTQWEVYIRGGRDATGIDALKWCKRVEELGAGEILLTSMDSDGQLFGYDLDLLSSVSENVNIALIASGGAGAPHHLLEAFQKGKADAVLAASIFHFGDYSVREVKDYLSSKGILIRRTN